MTTSRPDGSVMTATSPVAPARIAASMPRPPASSDGTDTTSSSPLKREASPDATTARTASRIAPTPPFLSQAPRASTPPPPPTPPPLPPPAAPPAAPRIDGPVRRVPDRHDIDVADEEDSPATGPTDPARH